MSRPALGHPGPSSLTTFLARPLIALAAIVGTQHDVFPRDPEEDETGSTGAVWLLVLVGVFGFWAFVGLFVAWMVGGGPR